MGADYSGDSSMEFRGEKASMARLRRVDVSDLGCAPSVRRRRLHYPGLTGPFGQLLLRYRRVSSNSGHGTDKASLSVAQPFQVIDARATGKAAISLQNNGTSRNGLPGPLITLPAWHSQALRSRQMGRSGGTGRLGARCLHKPLRLRSKRDRLTLLHAPRGYLLTPSCQAKPLLEQPLHDRKRQASSTHPNTRSLSRRLPG